MKKLDNPVYVTQPSLPDIEEYYELLKQIWDKKILTNNGPYHKQFENELAEFLGVPCVSLFANGTLALFTALKALNLTGEVITTPYSFVATSNCLYWNNLKPVFVDVEPEFYTIDPEKIKEAITPYTSAILPVHVYGNPCRIEQINEIARKWNLKVIYDAAHAFGENYRGKNICNYGDLSILSFHATKVFNTMEGGAIISHDESTKKYIDFLKNFGFKGETSVLEMGINSKMNEMQAALGLLQLKKHKENVNKREKIAHKYSAGLQGVKGLSILPEPLNATLNYSYFPIFIDEKKYGIPRDALYAKLKEYNIFGRRYFYPLITDFEVYKKAFQNNSGKFPVSRKASDSVICLPIYPDLDPDIADFIVSLIRNIQKEIKVL